MTTSLYHPTENAIACENEMRLHNRPLYGANLPSVVLSGDRPCLRLAYGQAVCGDLMLAFKRGEQVLWLHDFDDCYTTFKPNLTSWRLSDSRLEGLEPKLESAALTHRSILFGGLFQETNTFNPQPRMRMFAP
ncbi:MAG: hypothetical protein H7095_00380 [Pseudopedobacter sp.]|nr:hypothetical protein [Deinococcales bacterium]